MDLEIILQLLEDLNRQTNQAIDLVRVLRKGDLFGETLDETLKTKLITQAKTRYNGIKDTLVSLTEEVKK